MIDTEESITTEMYEDNRKKGYTTSDYYIRWVAEEYNECFDKLKR